MQDIVCSGGVPKNRSEFGPDSMQHIERGAFQATITWSIFKHKNNKKWKSSISVRLKSKWQHIAKSSFTSFLRHFIFHPVLIRPHLCPHFCPLFLRRFGRKEMPNTADKNDTWGYLTLNFEVSWVMNLFLLRNESLINSCRSLIIDSRIQRSGHVIYPRDSRPL